MIFSKQMKSLDRRFFAFRRHMSFLNRLYNYLSGINVDNSLYSTQERSIIRGLSQDAINKILAPTQKNDSSHVIPKIIWIYWHSGFETAPDVVKLSVQSWKKMNKNYDVRLIDDKNIVDHLGFEFNMAFQLSSVRCLLPTKADILRLHLLSRFGGVWVDATTFCLKPLDSWIDKASLICRLFNFKQKDNITRPIEAWFIAAPQSSPIINDALQQYVEFIIKPRKISLFVSGKVALLERLLSKEELMSPLLPSVSYRAETHGFMPYFSVAYFFFQALKNNLSSHELEIYLRQDAQKIMTNNYALTKDPFSEFENAYVSKQTYVSSYINSDLYKKRRDMLLNRLRSMD